MPSSVCREDACCQQLEWLGCERMIVKLRAIVGGFAKNSGERYQLLEFVLRSSVAVEVPAEAFCAFYLNWRSPAGEHLHLGG